MLSLPCSAPSKAADLVIVRANHAPHKLNLARANVRNAMHVIARVISIAPEALQSPGRQAMRRVGAGQLTLRCVLSSFQAPLQRLDVFD
jgi:hypothetical protein